MSGQRNLWDTANITGLLGSESGASPSVKPGGPTIDPSGPGVARVSLSPRQAKEAGLLMIATSGPRGSGSSTSADLGFCLANRLRPVTASLGSTLFKLTWKERVTPSGRSISALRASALRTSGSGFGSWPSPRAGESKGGEYSDSEKAIQRFLDPRRNNDLNEAAHLASWGTPKGTDGSGGRTTETKGGGNVHLDRQARLSGWATPASQEPGGTPEQHLARKVACAERGIQMGSSAVTHLSLQAQLTASGETPSGSGAEMKSGGQLNPALSRWLQGLPPEWCDCAVTAMQSIQQSRERS